LDAYILIPNVVLFSLNKGKVNSVVAGCDR
jgi:hypothetical protein